MTIKKSNFLSWDSIFSYWIFLWFFVFMFSSFYKEYNPIFHYIYENMNPFFLFLLALLSSIKNTIIILMYNPFSFQLPIHILKFLLLKFIPLYIVYYEKINIFENLIFSLFSIIIYLFYLFVMKKNVFYIYKELQNQIKNNNSNTSLEVLRF